MLALKKDTKTIGRLKKRSDFLRIQQSGQKWIAKSIVVEIAESAFEKPHYGITVSKKTSKSAVIRNRIKRRLRPVVQEVLPDYIDKNFDLVVIGRSLAETRDYEDLKKDLTWCLKKLGQEPSKQS
ncbi:MAG: ribonuclease P protein component [Pseudomonadota bacterium]